MSATTNSLPALKAFRSIAMGAGGTLTFPRTCNERAKVSTADLESPNYIGTLGCYTCVGVYFRVDENRCFLAHINAQIFGVGKDSNEAFLLKKGQSIKQQTLEALKAEAERRDWVPDPHYTHPSLTIVCPCQKLVEPALKNPGWYVIEALREFLGVSEDVKADHSTGLIVGRDGEVIMAETKGTPFGFEERPDEGLKVSEWCFSD